MDKKVLASVSTICLVIGLITSSTGMVLLGCVLLSGAFFAHMVEGQE